MRGERPILGYASHCEAVLDMCCQGVDLHDIADQLGITRKNAYVTLRYAKKRPAAANYVRGQLSEAARRRGITVDELECRLLGLIAREGLVDAILDDRREAAE